MWCILSVDLMLIIKYWEVMAKHTRGSYDCAIEEVCQCQKATVCSVRLCSSYLPPRSNDRMSDVDPVVIEYCEVMVRRRAF